MLEEEGTGKSARRRDLRKKSLVLIEKLGAGGVPSARNRAGAFAVQQDEDPRFFRKVTIKAGQKKRIVHPQGIKGGLLMKTT